MVLSKHFEENLTDSCSATQGCWFHDEQDTTLVVIQIPPDGDVLVSKLNPELLPIQVVVGAELLLYAVPTMDEEEFPLSFPLDPSVEDDWESWFFQTLVIPIALTTWLLHPKLVLLPPTRRLLMRCC